MALPTTEATGFPGDALFRNVFQNSPNAYLLLDTHLVILDCNRAYEQRVGTTRCQLVGRPVFQAFPAPLPERETQLKAAMQQAIDLGINTTIPMLHYPVSATQTPQLANPDTLQDRYWSVENIPLKDHQGSVRCLLNHVTDITDLNQLEQRQNQLEGNLGADTAGHAAAQFDQISASEPLIKMQHILQAERQRMQQWFQQAPGFICILSGPEHVFEIANDAYYELIGNRDAIGRTVAQVMPEVVEQGFLDKLNQVFLTGQPFIGRALPIRLRRQTGNSLSERYIDFIYQAIRDPAGKITGIFVQGHDVTESHILARKISYQAAHDPLTGLYNRREFSRLVKLLQGNKPTRAAERRSPQPTQPHTLLYLDLDQFKIINDRCGHSAGDELLRQVARMLNSRIRHSDILARLGGDEFALILLHCDINDAAAQADRLRTAMHDLAFFWNGRRYNLTLSIGLASFDNPTESRFDHVLSCADAACFLAKEKGRDRIQIYHPSDEELIRQQREMDWASRLKECLEQDRIVLYSQRIVDLHNTDHLDRRELLARMIDDAGNTVPPGVFIPAAERYGLMPALDRHIICKALAALNGLPADQRKSTLYFINISGITLSDDTLLYDIGRMLATFPGLDPRHVCFEITETAALSDLAASRSAMQSLINMGFSFALDDFGSGVSSFAYLRQLPVKYIKIDGEFITNIVNDPVSRAMVKAMTSVADIMNIETIGEFVESHELLALLRELGIGYGQGYGLHKPEPLHRT
jgi:diguanylate cyclase (GGDEF)-like protein